MVLPMRSGISVLVGAALMAACGGSGTGSAVVDAGSSEDACGVMVPDAAIYSCEAGPPGSVGCRASALDPSAASDPNVYPQGCTVTLPVQSTFCGPVGCMCLPNPTMHDAGLQFVCPL
jgi:hypothetical protein